MTDLGRELRDIAIQALHESTGTRPRPRCIECDGEGTLTREVSRLRGQYAEDVEVIVTCDECGGSGVRQ